MIRKTKGWVWIVIDMKLRSMDIENFKGIRALHLDFADGVTSIYGDNATGKTTIYDALCWLLFGKDSSGSAKFTVKPIGADRGVMPCVTAVLSVCGEQMTLRKTLREKWSKPRGVSQAQYDGDTVDYTVDDVPRKESEYKRIIGAYIDETRFRLLTGVHSFARDLPWKQRREQLADVCGLPADAEIMAGAPQFAPLAEALGRRTVDEYKAALMATRKASNKTLDSLPIRIDECERQIRELELLDYSKAQSDKAELETVRQTLLTDLAKLDGNALLAAAEAERKSLAADLQTLENENALHRQSQIVDETDERPTMRKQLNDATRALSEAKQEHDRRVAAMTQAQMQLDACGADWDRVAAEKLGSAKCPTCGQALPQARVAQMRSRFESEKAERLARIENEGKRLKESIQRDCEQIETLQKAMAERKQTIDSLNAQLDVYTAPAPQVIEDLPGYAARKTEMAGALAALDARNAALREDQQSVRQEICDKLAAVDDMLARTGKTLAAKETLDSTRARVEELVAEQRSCAAKLEQMDAKIALCEDYTRYRVQFITDSVNSRFKLARFRLFVEQLNGGLADCCDVTVDGVPYADLNNAMQINVGLDIIGTLSDHYGLRVPLFVDNAESVTKLQDIETQVIRLVVSENDKELRIE